MTTATDVPGFVRVEHRAGYRQWIADHDREVARRAWFQGATSRQCHCHAYSEGECACGLWPSERNPYDKH